MKHHRSASVAIALVLAGLLLWPAITLAQLGGLLPPPPTSGTSTSTVTGQATAAQVTVLGLLGTATTTTLGSTGISATNAESDVGQDTGSVPSLLGAEVLNASTYSYSNEVDSVASLANLGMTVAGITISADSVTSQASQVQGAAGSGTSTITNLAINGVPVTATGDPNQVVAIPGGQITLNEQTISSTGSVVVNAVHVVVNGVADVVLASATAGIS
ncbi:MAG TPA: choice-of-anchor P family protein [Candidatus Acidoferrum sp.]